MVTLSESTGLFSEKGLAEQDIRPEDIHFD
jgi:hypothetical protein